MSDIETNKRIKPVLSGHETFPLRYGWLKKIFDASLLIEKQEKSITKDLFNNIDAITILGVGKNMVASMRYWATYCKVLENKEDRLIVTNTAKELFNDEDGLDPWMENSATLWLIHWYLATAKELFSYNYLFNQLNTAYFDKNDLSTGIEKSLKEINCNVANKTIKRDVDCLLRVYSSKNVKDKSNEESFESPLAELDLVSPYSRRDLFQKKKGYKSNLSVYTFIFAVLNFWKKYSTSSKTLTIDSLCYAENSPGRIFLLDNESIGNYLPKLNEASNGLLDWSETAGLKQIILTKDVSNFETTAFEIFKRNY